MFLRVGVPLLQDPEYKVQVVSTVTYKSCRVLECLNDSCRVLDCSYDSCLHRGMLHKEEQRRGREVGGVLLVWVSRGLMSAVNSVLFYTLIMSGGCHCFSTIYGVLYKCVF